MASEVDTTGIRVEVASNIRVARVWARYISITFVQIVIAMNTTTVARVVDQMDCVSEINWIGAVGNFTFRLPIGKRITFQVIEAVKASLSPGLSVSKLTIHFYYLTRDFVFLNTMRPVIAWLGLTLLSSETPWLTLTTLKAEEAYLLSVTVFDAAGTYLHLIHPWRHNAYMEASTYTLDIYHYSLANLW